MRTMILSILKSERANDKSEERPIANKNIDLQSIRRLKRAFREGIRRDSRNAAHDLHL